MLKRLEFFCEGCGTGFTVWWESDGRPLKVICPVCGRLNVRFEGQYTYGAPRKCDT